MGSKYILDTNILIRFFTNDPKEQAEIVEEIFLAAEGKSLIIPDVVLVEAVFVLLSLYELPKEAIVEKMSSLITYDKFDLHRALFQKTLELYSKYSISFVDAYIGAKSGTKPTFPVYTFDKKILGIKEIRTIEPGKQQD